MNILIVGGLGYLGPVVCDQVRELIPVNKIDALDTGWFLEAALQSDDLNFDDIFLLDKRNAKLDFLKKYDVVVDLAAISNDPMGQAFEDATYRINKVAAVDLAKKCSMAGVKKFIYASSCSIYGQAGDKRRTENDPKMPLTAYAKSKWEAEKMLEPLGTRNFGIIALRFATACGWSPHFRADLVLNDFVLTAQIEGKISVLSDGTPWRPLIHAKDIGRSIAWACQTDKTGFDVYNVGSNKWTLTIGDLAAQVSDIMEVPFEIFDCQGHDTRSYKVAFDKFERDATGFLAIQNLRGAVSEMQQRLLPHLDNLQDFRSGDLMRLNVLKKLRFGNELSSEHG